MSERERQLLEALKDLRMRYEVLFGLYAKFSYDRDASSDLRLALKTADLAIAAAESAPPSLSALDELAKVYASNYASPHHITFTVEGLRNLLEHLTVLGPSPTP